MFLESDLSVSAISFQERMMDFSDSNIVKVFARHSFVVNDTG
jgi:hypothetical protein